MEYLIKIRKKKLKHVWVITTNSANSIVSFGSLLELATIKLLQKEDPETIEPVARTRRVA